jgi:hypothetical protein
MQTFEMKYSIRKAARVLPGIDCQGDGWERGAIPKEIEAISRPAELRRIASAGHIALGKLHR